MTEKAPRTYMNPLRMFANLFRRRSQPQPEIVVIPRQPNQILIAEWRATKDLVAKARAVLSDPDVRMMLDTVRNSAPLLSVTSEYLPSHVRSVMLGRIEGYEMAMNDLEALASYAEPKEMPEATFEPQELPTETDSDS